MEKFTFNGVIKEKAFHDGRLVNEGEKVTWSPTDGIIEIIKRDKKQLIDFVPPYIEITDELPIAKHLDEGSLNSGGNQQEILDALARLDKDNDELWNKNGSPKVGAVNALLSFDISADELKAAAPDFKRPE